MKKTKLSIIILILCLSIITPMVSWGFENWMYDNEKKSAISVYETTDNQGWNVFLVFQVSTDKIYFSALIPFSDYQKYFNLNLPVQFKYKGKDLVRHETFFWGENNTSVAIRIDDQEIDGFTRISGYQMAYKGNNRKNVIAKLKNGESVRIGKHYWNKEGKKKYPSFSLIGFSKAFSNIDSSVNPQTPKEYPISGLRCKNKGAKKIVWINTPHGSYALNGQAITWVKTAENGGYPILGFDGLPIKIGRDHIPLDKLHDLIKEGLKKCRQCQ